MRAFVVTGRHFEHLSPTLAHPFIEIVELPEMAGCSQ